MHIAVARVAEHDVMQPSSSEHENKSSLVSNPLHAMFHLCVYSRLQNKPSRWALSF